MTAPEVLLLDDGELDRVHRTLRKLGVDVVRLQGSAIDDEVVAPRALLVVSGPRSLDPPRFLDPETSAPNEPVRMCFHSQDFQPLRERLAAGGIHLLVQSSIDDQGLELLLLSVLHNRGNRRHSIRTRLQADLRVVIEGQSGNAAELADIGLDACRIHFTTRPADGAEARLSLAAELTGGHSMIVQGRVVRSAQRDDDEYPFAAVVAYDADLAPETRKLIEALVEGRRLGAEVASLAPMPRADDACNTPAYIDGTGIPDWADLAQHAERRRDARRRYDEPVETFTGFAKGAPHCALGRDLSSTGVSIVGHPPLAVGTPVTLSLHSGGRSEPVVVDALVTRGDDAIALEFVSLTPALVQQLERVVAAGTTLASVGAAAEGGDGALVVSEFLEVGT